MRRLPLLFLCALLSVIACDDDSTSPRKQAPLLDLIIGDIEGTASGGCTLTTIEGGNSLNVGDTISTATELSFSALVDSTGETTTIGFALEAGGAGGNYTIFCNQAGTDLEADGFTANGPVLIKPWRITGLKPGASYTMTFTGGGWGSPNRSIRQFVDVDGNGSLEPTEVEDLIGLDGVIETRTFGQTIKADDAGTIIGEYWGGSTNDVGQNGAWRGWTIIGTP